MRPGLGAALGLAGAAALLALWARQFDGDREPVVVLAAAAAQARPSAVVPAAAGTTPPGLARREAAGFAGWMQAHSSLRGSTLDGSWSELDAQGRLKPALALRRRFDQLLTLQGEATLEQITAYVEQEVLAAQGAEAARQVMEVWRRYVELQRYRFSTRVDLQDQQSWGAALAERQPVRRNLLGAEWAAAFYADEEAELQAALRGSVSSPAQSGTPIDTATLSPQARQRLAAEQIAWADWEARLAQARQEWARLHAAAELSTPQRLAALEQWLQPRFDAGEQRRVRALLQLPAPAS